MGGVNLICFLVVDKAAVGVVDEEVLVLCLFAVIVNVIVVDEVVDEVLINAVVFNHSKAVRYCCLDSLISR